MSEDSPIDVWEEWFASGGVEPEPDERFKWGWSPERGETVWIVGGPGDGRPSHREYLESAWGTAVDLERDVLGLACRYAGGVRDEEDDREVIEIDAFYDKQVPASVMDWFKEAFPQALLRPSND